MYRVLRYIYVIVVLQDLRFTKIYTAAYEIFGLLRAPGVLSGLGAE